MLRITGEGEMSNLKLLMVRMDLVGGITSEVRELRLGVLSYSLFHTIGVWNLSVPI